MNALFVGMFRGILKLDESCISDPKSEIANCTRPVGIGGIVYTIVDTLLAGKYCGSEGAV